MLPTVFAQAREIFPEQVTTNSLAQNIVYVSGTVGALVILAGLLLVDMGGVRRVNQFDSVIQKLIAFFIGFVVYFIIGFAIWNWQYYVAFDIPDPYWQSVKDWWLGGTLSSQLAQTADPAVAPGLNNQQIFIFFLACFAGIINVLIGLAVTERIKPSAYFAVSAVAAVVSSLLSWLTWGSTGPLTNLGYHDFFGSGFVYVFAGAVALVLVRALGQRPGMYRPHRVVGEYRSYNLGITTIGLVMIIGGLPFVILSCGFFFEPEALFVSVNMSDTSIGIAFNNLGLAWAGGAITGAIIAYRTKKYIYTLLGPFAGYVSGAPAFDVYEPWQMFLVAIAAPLVAYAVYEWTQKREIDEHKLIPLFLGVGSYGILMVGLIDWGTADRRLLRRHRGRLRVPERGDERALAGDRPRRLHRGGPRDRLGHRGDLQGDGAAWRSPRTSRSRATTRATGRSSTTSSRPAATASPSRRLPRRSTVPGTGSRPATRERPAPA